MPLDRYSYHDAFDIEVLNPQALHTSDGLQTALRAIEAVCYRGDPEIARMVEVLNSRSCLLEYIISGMLRTLIGLRALPVLIVLPSSFGGRGIYEGLKMDGYRVSRIRGAKHERHGYAAPPEIFVFTAVREVSIHYRRTSQPLCVREKGRTLAQCPKEY